MTRTATIDSTNSYSTSPYYASAFGITITRARALKELKAHGCTEWSIRDFFHDMGDHESYKAQAVLDWLGY